MVFQMKPCQTMELRSLVLNLESQEIRILPCYIKFTLSAIQWTGGAHDANNQTFAEEG